MMTKIAVIGSSEFMGKILSVAAKMQGIEIDPYIYQEPSESAAIIKTLKPCDIVFFSGALPYYFSKKQREKLTVPALYLKQDELAFASSFLQIIYTKNISPERISIDLIDSSIVTNLLNDSKIIAQPFVIDYREMLAEPCFDTNRIVKFHQSLWEQGAIDIALTSIHIVYDRLHELGIPALRMTDPEISLLRGLQNAQDQADLHKSKSAQVAVGYLMLQSFRTERVEQFANEINASFQEQQDNILLLYSTRGDIEEAMEKQTLHDFLEKSKESLLAGFGFGTNMKEADQHAQIALQFAEKDVNPTSCFILTEDKELLGPFPHVKRNQRLKSDHPETLLIAKQTKLSPANVSKIIEFSKSRHTLQFTAADLADYLQVTRRSTERIIKKLVDHRYAKVVGEEMTYQQGRPRAVYELKLPIYF
ncbi:transcriptional regulator [Bacillus sp. MRMR6]|uniref:transcriptional regulator n=1 Tax=Bacillus sp. MRMR6 TaxID=1928617 RepID=UPI000952E49B|nr:transcriptional regulator [Bacillus sp. MRMR6]OLS41025.1 transcriptional regulator [Bacillus sp. MRMR6]